MRNRSLFLDLSRAENVTGLKPRTEAAGGRAFGAPAVAERSVGRRRWHASAAGGIGSANADMSSDNEGERPSRRKSKGSCARLIRAGLAGPLRRGRKP